ncbi:ankyrin repeat domain-containing protein [Streptomyces sp. NPDC001966]
MSEAMTESLFAAVTPVHGDDASERAAQVRSLITGGADVSARDENGATPLHWAVKAPSVGGRHISGGPLPSLEIARVLLECGADVHAADQDGVTPAAWAVVLNRFLPSDQEARVLGLLMLLLEHGARLDGPSNISTGGSFAHYGMVAPELYALLLQHGAPIVAVDNRGDTPLHVTVSAARPDLVQLLLDRGADTAAVNGLGQTPLGIARRLERNEIVALLEAAGAPAHVRYPAVEGGPLPIDMDTVRRVAGELNSDGDSDWLTELVEPDLDSYQELVAELCTYEHDPDQLHLLSELCAGALGDTRTTRTLVGDQRMTTPFFHHGDLEVQGDLDITVPFVVTGSLTVEGVLADVASDSVVVIDGGLKARGVFTEADMRVYGDVEAEVVYGHYNDHTLETGVIRARLVIEDDHYTETSGVEAELYLKSDDYANNDERLHGLLVDDVFAIDEDEDEEEEEVLDHRLLFARLREGLPVFRINKQAKTH